MSPLHSLKIAGGLLGMSIKITGIVLLRSIAIASQKGYSMYPPAERAPLWKMRIEAIAVGLSSDLSVREEIHRSKTLTDNPTTFVESVRAWLSR